MNGNREEASGNIRTEEVNTGIENEGEHWTEERKNSDIYVFWTSIMGTQTYTPNTENHLGKELDLIQ